MSQNPSSTRRAPRAGLALAAAMAAGLALGGCAKRDSIIVGSTPDDYRTNHPIMIAEREVAIDIPVGTTDHGLSRIQRTAIDGFAADYDRKAAPLVTILVPRGAANDVAASSVAAGLAHRLHANGVPKGRIITQAYQAPAYDLPAPIRVSYVAMRAQTGPCGRWPADLADTTDNKHYANFGCAYQNNLAAQIANPADLLGPRKTTEVDTERRMVTIEDYRLRESTWDSEVDY